MEKPKRLRIKDMIIDIPEGLTAAECDAYLKRASDPMTGKSLPTERELEIGSFLSKVMEASVTQGFMVFQ